MTFKKDGLIKDLWPNIRLIQLSGLFISEYYEDYSGLTVLMRKIYSWITTVLIYSQYLFIVIFMFTKSYDSDQLAAGVVTTLFFAHSMIKYMYFSTGTKSFYRTLGCWNNTSPHPLFAESHSRFHSISLARMRQLLVIVSIVTIFATISWTTITFFDDNVWDVPNPETFNETMAVQVPKLMLRSWYPWDASHGIGYIVAFVYQFYWIFITLTHANLCEVLFSSFLIHACEQLKHLKEILSPLIELSSALDTVAPNQSDIFRASSAKSIEGFEQDYKTSYTNEITEYGNLTKRNTETNGKGPNNLTSNQEVLVRSAIKYWVERHKHVVKYVGLITDCYGSALLMHMLVSTVILTILAYQATKINGINVFALSTIGYILYSFAHIFMFCIHGNELIEESSSVMEAAYSCHWYDGSEEAKTFVQIVCQQCQKPLIVSGAKFFNVSLDLFASVLGAAVTYFMVLVQLK
ncbi:odorant receptor coreceptor [Daktulosphaira vitifoliae]|uniref:odorant receptor coreceptor n=1 Tax=Daktulosphaira vitifoliae TaxID=58002 RepID=UPI0021AAF515|nr:odorant receptor coreceptor [Daktulosphaira vitifoliae]XP_050548962.1 odorant receptor coreceptor [Daktulosphaira vitifoliae]XP_050548963.1 odorant receptor coreceptor [Daktulosphaira vitifoliae]